MAALASSLGEGLLLAQFRAFYAEVVELKRRAQIGDTTLIAGDDGEAAPGPTAMAAAISGRLVGVLERGAGEVARRSGSYAAALFREAQYVMAALADEIFLHFLEWDGKAAWRDNLLETRLFHSYVAGERLFKRIDEILAGHDRLQAELAAVYLLALSLGFRGKFRDVDDGGRVDEYRRQLYQFVVQHPPGQAEAAPLFPNAYSHTLAKGADKRLPHLRLWLVLLAVFFGGYLIASHLLWDGVTATITATLARVI